MYKFDFALIGAYFAHCEEYGLEPTWNGAATFRGIVKLNYLAAIHDYGWLDTPTTWRGYLVSLAAISRQRGGDQVA